MLEDEGTGSGALVRQLFVRHAVLVHATCV